MNQGVTGTLDQRLVEQEACGDIDAVIPANVL
jgi:hypothetical protein